MLLRCPALEVRQLNRILSQVYDDALAPAGLTSVQFGILTNIATYPRSAMGALAEVVGVDPTTLKRLVAPLIDRDLVAVQRGSDQRHRVLALTGKGKKAFEDGVALWRHASGELAERIELDRLGMFRDVVMEVLRALRGDNSVEG
jgi:DNA-binding MarR family transcriptional regulator